MHEVFGPCLRPWVKKDAAILQAALRRASLKPGTDAANRIVAVVTRSFRDVDEVEYDSPEAYYIVVPALEQLLEEASRDDACKASSQTLADLMSRTEYMPPELARRVEALSDRKLGSSAAA